MLPIELYTLIPLNNLLILAYHCYNGFCYWTVSKRRVLCVWHLMHYTVIRSDARYETTAAWQAAEASTAELQNEVERNARKTHNVAEQAAAEAEVSCVAV